MRRQSPSPNAKPWHMIQSLQELYNKVNPKPERLYADSAYDTNEVRVRLEADGVEANILVNPRNGREEYRIMLKAMG